MRTTGIRQLKDRLSHYIRLAKEGEEILITDRGEVVASLAPPSSRHVEGVPQGLVELARQGRARLGGINRPQLYRKQRRVLERDLSLELLDELRGER